MSAVYYEYSFTYSIGSAAPTGLYVNVGQPSNEVTLDAGASWYWSSIVSTLGVCNLTGSGPSIAYWEANTTTWNNVIPKTLRRNESNIVLADALISGSPSSDVTWEIDDVESGSYDPQNRIFLSMTDGQVLVPILDGYSFDPPSFTYDEAQGLGAHVVFTGTDETTIPTLDYPTDLLTNVYLNTDGMLEMRWSDGDDEDISYYTVYFGFKGGTLIPQNDRSRYSIVTLKMNLGEQLEYDTDYEWYVRKTIGGQDYDSDTYEFKTVGFVPPGPKGTPVNGLNGIVTIKRVVAAADDKIWYET
jgi:hypothetical protein